MVIRLLPGIPGARGPTHPPATLPNDPAAVRVAAAAQTTVETVVGWLVEHARTLTGIEQVCIAGGVGLNCAANGRLPGPVYVPPVPHDAGVALGAAWTLAVPTTGQVFSPYTGGAPGPVPQSGDLPWHGVDPENVAELLEQGKIVGVCRGRSEVGPRALGHRSFLALPTDPGMRERMNQLKRREPWRPFGPLTHVDPYQWGDPSEHLHRYMLGAAHLTQAGAKALPAVRHQDGTTRPQQLHPGQEDLVWEVLEVLGRRGHPPVLLNTSFNGPGEPLVETAAQALACARRLGADALRRLSAGQGLDVRRRWVHGRFFRRLLYLECAFTGRRRAQLLADDLYRRYLAPKTIELLFQHSEQVGELV